MSLPLLFNVPNLGAYSAEVLADSPRAFWRFDEAAGLPQDSSGNGNHATSSGGTPVPNQAKLIPSEASTLKSTLLASGFGNAHYLVPDDADLDLGDVFSIEFWIKLNTSGAVPRGVVSKGGGSYYVRIETDNRVGLLRSGVANLLFSNTTLAADASTVYHVVATKNGSARAIYVNGELDVQVGTGSNSTCVDNANTLAIGADNAPLGEYANEWLDGLALYPVALTAAQIGRHYEAGIQDMPTDYAQPIADTPAATDARSIRVVKAIADTPAVTDARTLKPGKGVADAGALTDATTRAAGKGIADSIAGTDATARAAAKMLADAAAGTDALAKAIGRTSTDAAAIVDAVATARGLGALIADSLTVADALARAAVFARTVSDAGALTDARSAAAGVLRADSAAVADALARAAGVRVVEAAMLTDAAARAVTTRVADSLAATDAARRASARSIVEALLVADSSSAVAGYFRQLDDDVNIVDGAETISSGGNNYTQEIMDAIEAVDVAASMASFARGLSDAAQAADALAFAAAYRRSAGEALAASDALAKSVAKLRVEALTGVDAVTRAWAAQRTISDVGTLLDLVSTSTASSTAFVKLLQESLEADDELRTAIGVQLVEGLSIVDALDRRRGLVIADALEVADVSIRSSGIIRALADALVIDDELTRAAGARGGPSYLVLGAAVTGLGLSGGSSTRARPTGGSGTIGLDEPDESEIDL